jgi:hypothetical protein
MRGVHLAHSVQTSSRTEACRIIFGFVSVRETDLPLRTSYYSKKDVPLSPFHSPYDTTPLDKDTKNPRVDDIELENTVLFRHSVKSSPDGKTGVDDSNFKNVVPEGPPYKPKKP